MTLTCLDPQAMSLPLLDASTASGVRPAGCWRLAPLCRIVVALIALAWGGQARALCLPAACSCSVVVTNIVFAAYNPLAFGNTDSSGTIKVTCGGVAGLLVPFTVDLGKGGGGSFAARRLSSGANTLSYNLYGDSNYTTIWGDGTLSTVRGSGSVLLDVLGLTPGQVFTVYGRIPGRQLTVPPGTYTDSVTITVTYQ